MMSAQSRQHPFVLRHARAHGYLEKLKVEESRWFDGKRNRSWTEPDPKGGDHFILYAEAENPPLNPISLLISDCLHNLRSTLDNLAFELAGAYIQPLPDEIAESSELPIFGDVNRKGRSGTGSTRFHAKSKTGIPQTGSGLAKIQGMDPLAQAIIERVQPYQAGKQYISEPLWILHELSRIDKHRLLHIVAAAFAGVVLDTTRSENAQLLPGVVKVETGVIEGKTKVARFRAGPIDPERKMNVHIEPAFHVAFPKDAPVAAERPAVEVLREIYDFIRDKVISPLLRFLP